MNKNRHKSAKGGIENATLAYIAILAVLLCVWGANKFLFTNNPASEWMSLQTSAFGKTWSGQVLGAFDDKSKLPKSIQLPILMYHHVGYVPQNAKGDQLRENLTVSPENFEMQVAWLKAYGFNSITLEQFYEYTEGKYELPQNPIIFTFDDGYSDVFQYAVPILKKYNYVGSFAVITQFDGLKYGSNEYATWEEIRKAQKQGMEIVSHTQDHFDGTDKFVSQTFIYNNLKGSQEDIHNNLGTEPLPILVYPYGHYNQGYIETAEKAGFKLGLTTNPGKTVELSNLMEIPRIRMPAHQDFEHFKKLVTE